MQLSLIILAIFAAASKDVNGLKLKVDHARLGKRQSSDTACVSTCSSYQTITSQCSALISTGGYASCICSSPAVQAIAQCVNCGISYSASQADIDTIENVVNTYISACATLGYPISIPVTTQPAVSFPCTIGFHTGANTLSTARTTATNPATVTVTTGAATNPFAVPTDFSMDPSELSLISSLLGGVSSASTATGVGL